VFSDVSTSQCTLYVPTGSVYLYRAADQWKDFTNIVGIDVTWEFADGTLTIGGTGDMISNASASDVPWYGYRTEIKTVVIGSGITGISDYAFA
jgi:hypothetical protein